MTTDIYNQHQAAFKHVSAYVILKDGQRVATIAFRFPKDGAGRLWAYVHWIGIEMVRGHAGGYGYDKRSAAVESAVGKAIKASEGKRKDNLTDNDFLCATFHRVLSNIGGNTWDRALTDAGFTVLQAV